MRGLLRVGALFDERRARVQRADEVHADVRRLGPRGLLEEDQLLGRRRAAPAVLLRPVQPRVPGVEQPALPVGVPLRRSGHASRGGAGASAGKVASSQARRSARKASSASEYRRSTGGVYESDGSSDSIRPGREPIRPLPALPDAPRSTHGGRAAEDHQRRRPRRRARAPLGSLAPGAVPRTRPARRAARHRVDDATSAAARYEQSFDDDGPKADCWVYEDLVYINKRHVAAVGFDRDDMTMSPITYDEMRPGCYEPKARIDDMEMNWVDASLSFPTFPRFCGQTFLEAKDRELAHACVVAYNDWMVEEWCGDSGGRLIPLTIVPLWDPAARGRRGRRNAARGVHAVCFSEIPPKLGLPTIHSGEWDPFFAACQDTNTVVCMHIGSSSPDAGDVGRRAGCGRRDAVVQQRDGVALRLPLLRRARALPGAEARLLGGPDRLAAVRARARRRRVA